MSHFEVEASQHDIFLSLAINALLTSKGGALLFTDGGLPFRSHCRSSPPILGSYRPDAVVQSEDKTWIIEVKSYDDLFSTHTAEQLQCIHNLMKHSKDICLNLFVFGVGHRNVSVPELLLDFVDTERLVINFTELSVAEAQ